MSKKTELTFRSCVGGCGKGRAAGSRFGLRGEAGRMHSKKWRACGCYVMR
jgi:hypothetical protein